MDTPKTKIAFYQHRSFSDKMNASFDFIKENWKSILKYSTYMILPICLLQALSFNKVMGAALNNEIMGVYLEADPFGPEMMSFWANYSLLFFFLSIGGLIMGSVTCGLIKTYNDRPNGLQDVTFSELWPLFLNNFGRLILLMLVGFALMILVWIVIALLGYYISEVIVMLAVILMLVLIVPLALWTPIYLYERASIFNALAKSFRLGFATWGGIFAVLFVMGIIAYILQGVVAMPWAISMVVNQLFTLSEFGGNGADPSVATSFMNYIFAVLASYGAYLSMILVIVGISYQYSHANEKLSHISVESDIENFEQL